MTKSCVFVEEKDKNKRNKWKKFIEVEEIRLWNCGIFLFLISEQKLGNIPKLTTAYERLEFVICKEETVITIILPYLSQRVVEKIVEINCERV